MIQKYKGNNRTYIHKCRNCNSKFLYNYIDIEVRYYSKEKTINCPFCNEINEVKLHRFIFKSSKQLSHIEKEKQLNEEIENLKAENRKLNNISQKRFVKIEKYMRTNQLILDYMKNQNSNNLINKHFKKIKEYILEEGN